MNKVYTYFLALLGSLLLTTQTQAEDKTKLFDHVHEAVSGLNMLIERNEKLLRNGESGDLNFIYDFRHPALIAQADKLPENLVNDINLQLKNLNDQTGIRFYAMMSDLYEILAQHEYRTNGYIHYVIEGKVYTVSDADEWENTDAATALKRKNEEIAKEFTRLVAERSRISDETKKGVLLNIEALFLPGQTQRWTFLPIVALGRHLSVGTVLQVKEYLTRNLSRSYDFDTQFDASFRHYVSVIGANLMTFEGEFAAEEIGGTIEAQMLSYDDADGKIWGTLGHKYTAPAQLINSNYIIKDYAHILEADQRFAETVSTNLYDANTVNSLSELTGGEHVKFVIYTTSDKNLDPSGRSAIQLAAEEGIRQYENQNVIIMGLHYRIEESGSRVQVITRFSKQLEKIIHDKRAEGSYAWYRNTTNNHVVYGSRLVTYRYTSPFTSNDNWELLGKHRAIGPNDKVYFNRHSDFYLWALFLNKLEDTEAEINAFMYEHSEQIANGVINVAFIAATGGSSIVIQGARSVLVYGSKVAMGFTLDIIFQASLYKYFNPSAKKPEDISWEEAFEKVDYWKASRTGAESLYESAVAAGALGCIGDMITLSASGNDLKVETPLNMESMSQACIKGFLMNAIIVKMIKVGGQGLQKLRKLATENPQAFARGLAAFGLPEQEVEAFVVSLGLSKAFTQQVLLQYKIQLSQYLSRLATKRFFDHFDDVVIENGIVKLYKNGDEVARIVDDKIHVTKWLSEHKDIIGISELDNGYKLVKNTTNNSYGIDLGFRENRSLSAEEVNTFMFKAKGYNPKGQPYPNGTTVIDRTLPIGEKIYIVEYATQTGPGQFFSKEKITTIKELREKLAVLQDWKDEAKGILVVREYKVIAPLKVRDGGIGPQIEETGINIGKTYPGGGHQYEVIANFKEIKFSDFLERTGVQENLK